MGGTLANLNAIRNGRKLSQRRLVLGELPRELLTVKRSCRQYRRELEAVVLAKHGEISIVQAHHVDAAAGHELHRQICQWLLRTRLKDMATPDVIACSKQIAAARDARNRCVAALRLDDGSDILNALYSPVPPNASDVRSEGIDGQ